jgi:hypothetical protein
MLPPIPPNGYRRAAEVAELPGAVVIPEEYAAVGPALSSWAYLQSNDVWNIFQLPIK